MSSFTGLGAFVPFTSFAFKLLGGFIVMGALVGSPRQRNFNRKISKDTKGASSMQSSKTQILKPLVSGMLTLPCSDLLFLPIS